MIVKYVNRKSLPILFRHLTDLLWKVFQPFANVRQLVVTFLYSYIGDAPYSLPAGQFAGKNISWLQEESIFKKNNEFQSSFSIG